MKNLLFSLLTFLLLPFAAHAQVATIEVENPTNKLRDNVAIAATHNRFPKGDYVVIQRIISRNRPELLQEIPSQAVEDGLVFVADLPAKSKSVFMVQPRVMQTFEYPQRVYAQLKLRDQKLRYPRINSVEFDGTADPRATYDAIYGHGAM